MKIAAWTGGGLLISMVIPLKGHSADVSHHKSFVPHAFLRIGDDKSITVILSKVEMGQGIWTTLPMLIAEELDCDWNNVKVEHSPTGTADDFLQPPIDRATGGSETTVSQFDMYRRAGATARIMLVNAASKRLRVRPEECTTKNGYVISGNTQISYGDLAAEASLLKIPVDIKLREPKDWKYIGKSQNRLDGAIKVNGKAQYGIDLHFPGLLTALVAHAPMFGGKVKSFDASKATEVDGVRHVIQIPTGIAVLADNFWAAKMGRDALMVEWHNNLHYSLTSDEIFTEYSTLSKSKGLVVLEKGDVHTSLAQAKQTITAEYKFPFLAHAPMEPLNCIVNISEDACEIWAGTQSPLLHQAEVAQFLELRPEQVTFHTPHLGGSFGRRGSFSNDWVMEAVNIAKISGKFIKLIWTREDDIKGGYYRPVYTHRLDIGVGNDGYPTAWQHCIVGQSLFENTPLQKHIIHNGIDYSSVTTAHPYSESIANYSFSLVTTTLDVPVLPWRSVGNTHTAFVTETLIDELATLAKADPVDFRRKFYQNAPRHLAVLNLVVKKADWYESAEGIYKGLAVHEAMGSCVAQIIEISIKESKLQIHRVICAIDCGLAVNPDGVRAQIEGGIIFGLTSALYGEITLERGRVQQSNFHDYKMLRMHESPKIEVHIVPGTTKMGGAGEPGVPPIAPALANAIFSATGNRLRELPVRQSDLIRQRR